MRRDEVHLIASQSEHLQASLDFLNGLHKLAASEERLDVLLQYLLDGACGLIGARYGALSLFDVSGRIRQLITYGISEEEYKLAGALPKDLGILSCLQESEKSLRLADLSRHPLSVGFPPNHPEMKTFLGAPIREGNESLGNLYLTEKLVGGEFTPDDEELIILFAAQAALLISDVGRRGLDGDFSNHQSRKPDKTDSENPGHGHPSGLAYRCRLVPSLRLDHITPAAAETLGYDPAAYYDSPNLLFETVDACDRLLLEAVLRAPGLFPGPVTLHWMRKDGSSVWIEQRTTPVHDAMGRLIGAHAMLRDITPAKVAETALRKRTHDLRERVKELNLLYSVSELLRQPELSLVYTLKRVADLIPQAWQYPGITCARILLDEQAFQTDNFRETQWKQASPIIVDGKEAGSIEVCYLEERSECDEGPFLKEERGLIKVVSERLGASIEQKRTDAELRAREQVLRRQAELLDLAKEAIFVRDIDTSIVSYWNQGAERMYGWTKVEAVGKVSHGLLHTQFSQPLPEIEAELVQWGHWEGQIVHQRRDGTNVVVASRWALQRDERGKPLAALQIDNDISERKRAEESIESQRVLELVETSPVGIVVADKAGVILVINREAQRILGFSYRAGLRLEEYERLGPVRHRMDGSSVPPEEAPIRRAIEKGEAIRAEEITFRFTDGRSIPTLVSTAPFYGARGEITGAIVAIQDISPLEEIERLRNEFLGMISHELRSPLTAIKGSSALALSSPDVLEPQTKELLEIIEGEANALSELVSNLLDMTSIKAGALSVHPEPVDLKDIIEEARRAFRRRGNPQEVQVDLPGPILVKADRRRIIQVLTNLLNNAAKSSPPDRPVLISVHQLGLFVTVRVRDRGSGIPAEKLPQLFKKFSLFSDEGEGASSGTGLGLAICKGIVEAHGGRIWASSAGEGQGAIFTFTLPLGSTVLAPAPENEGAAVSERLVKQTGEACILAVDDDRHVLRYLQRSLAEAGYRPITTDDVKEVARLVELEEPDLLLLDVMLSGTDGFDLLENVREYSDVPVIFLTGRGREDDIVRAFRMGADDYITKPFSRSELLARIDAVLRRRSQSKPRMREAYSLDGLTVDFIERTIVVDGRPVHLSAIEYKLLHELATHAGRVLTYDQILEHVWGKEYGGATGLLRSVVRNLRAKLGDDARHPRFVITEPQVGYKMPRSER